MSKLLNIRGKLLDLGQPRIMGILNLTPDSFYDGGAYRNDDDVLRQVERMLRDGMSILDIGASSSRPGAVDAGEEEELARLRPLARITAEFPGLPVSVDTFRSRVASEAVAAGAAIVNDISAGEADPAMIGTIARLGVPFIGMHRQGSSLTMQQNPQYHNVVSDITGYFAEKVPAWRLAGINDLVIDPGFGFGKNLQHNYSLLRGLSRFKIFGLPILVGLSRKAMICQALRVDPPKALNGTTAAHMLALLGGADILRVHDVREAREAIEVFGNYERAPV